MPQALGEEAWDERTVKSAEILSHGGGIKEVAGQLNKTLQSTKNMMQRIYERTGTDGMTHFVATALRKGIIQ